MTTATEEIIVSVTPRNRANFRRLKTNSIQSYKRWEKENELLYAMMEDESEWLAKLFPDVVITPDFFFYALEDGSLLCRLANYIQEKAESYSQRHNIPVPGKKFRYHSMGKCSKEIKLFKSRENVQQFLTWCRSHGIPEAILFESNDVVQVDDYREGCRGIIICLMEIVRRTAKFELDELPKLIQMEKEIEEDEAQSHTDLSNGQGQVLDVEEINMTEIDNLEVHRTDPPDIQSPSSMDSDSGVDSVFDLEEGDSAASRLKEFWHEETEIKEKTEITTTTVTRKQNLLKPKDQKSSAKKTSKELPSLLESTGPKSELDRQVCKIAQDYNIKVVHRLKEGKYIILGRIMFVRMLNEHMLVRIGGGWDTLEHYLMTHAPSKEALETPSAPSSQAVTSPRNSISANSGVRTSLIEKFKKKEQLGVVNRDSPVYSSQGSLHQQLGNQSSPKIKDRGKRSSLTDKDEKDITEAIRKISSTVSQTLADRPASFTSKSFNALKSRFDKGIFGASRRTSSPDLSVKGSKIQRRLSDTITMADVATTLAFDGEQVPVINNNVSDEKQAESESTEEIGVGKIAVPIENAPGDEPPENTASDQMDGSVPVGDSVSSEQSRLEDLLGSQANGNANISDISSFDPFAAVPAEDKPVPIPVPIPVPSSEKTVEQPSNSELFGNGELAHDEQPPERVTETTVESLPPQIIDSLLEITDTKPVLDSTPEDSPRPIDMGDLLQDSQASAEEEGSVEPSPLINLEETAAPEEPVLETESADVKPVNSDKPVVNEDVTPSIKEVPPIEADPSPETESQPPEVAPAKAEAPPRGEETEDTSESSEPSKLEEEPGKTDETVATVETAVEQPEPPKPEEATAEVDEPVGDLAVVKSEGESTEAAHAVDESSTQEQSQAQEAANVQVTESAPEVAAEGKGEDKPAEDQPSKAEKPKEKAAKAKPAAAGVKEKSPTKPSSAAKKPMGGARPTSPTKGSTSAAAKKDVKAPAIKVPPSKSASAKAPAVKAPATKAPIAKAPATKTTALAAAGIKKPATKPTETKADEAKKPQRPKSAVAARPPTQPAARATSVADKKVPASATKTAAAKTTGKDVKDAGPPKSAPKTTITKPSSAKPTPKTNAPGKKPLSAKVTPTPSTKPADSKDGAALPKKPAARPTSAKLKPTTSSTTTTTTVKKTTTVTTTITKSGTVAPGGKTQTTTTKTVTQARTGQPKTTSTSSTTTKTSAKAPARPTTAAKKPTDTKPTSTGAKSKTGGKPSAASVGGKPAPKSASKKKAEEPAKEKEQKPDEKPPVSQPEPEATNDEKPKENELKQEEKPQVSQPEPEAATDEKPTEDVEIKTEEKPTETVETVSEERSVSEAISEDKSIEVSSEEFVDQANVVTHFITTETTTVNEDGEEQTTKTTTGGSVNEQTVEGS